MPLIGEALSTSNFASEAMTSAVTINCLSLTWLMLAGLCSAVLASSAALVAPALALPIEGEPNSDIRIESPEFCALAAAVLDGQGPRSSKRLLVVACGRAENAGMKFNQERTSVGREWGEEPVRAEAVTGSWRLPEGEWRAWALKPDGSKGAEIPLETREGRPVLRMSPEYGTVCYLLEKKP